MTAFLNILFVLTALLLIGVVLIQQPKANSGLFAGTGQSLLGTSGKTFWTKFTTIVAGVFMLLCMLLALFRGGEDAGKSSVAEDIAKQQNSQVPVTATTQAPASQAVPVQQKPAAKPEPQKAPATDAKGSPKN